MTIEQSKEKLKKEGYTWLELSEFDSEFYNLLLPFKCNEINNLKNEMTQLRVSALENLNELQINEKKLRGEELANINFHEDFGEYDIASQKKNEVFDLIEKNKNIVCSQIWYYADSAKLLKDDTTINLFEKHIYKLIRYYFDFEETQKFCLFAPCFTYYDKGCKLKTHSDGTGTGRVCALLIYLNEEYDENDGGILVLNKTEKVIPTFGKVAMIDLQSFDIKHAVTEVTGGIGRYAFLSFIKTIEMQDIHSTDDLKKSLI